MSEEIQNVFLNSANHLCFYVKRKGGDILQVLPTSSIRHIIRKDAQTIIHYVDEDYRRRFPSNSTNTASATISGLEEEEHNTLVKDMKNFLYRSTFTEKL